jgi:hypothetical protein
MQHMMNFATGIITRAPYNDTWLMDTWIDEGLSLTAEWVYSGSNIDGRLNWYNAGASGTRIRTGNNFFVWDQYGDDSVLDDYATAYLFFQWLRLQSGGSTAIYRNIIGSRYSDYNAVVNAMNGYKDWPTRLKTWLAANYINAPSGPYGYMNDSALRNVRARTIPSGISSVNLYPGEGVYSATNSSGTTPNPGINIRYAGLSKSPDDVDDTATFASGVLLTYNIDTNQANRTEAGTTTGIAASIDIITESLSVQVTLSGSFFIDAKDMMRRYGQGEDNPPPLRLPKE